MEATRSCFRLAVVIFSLFPFLRAGRTVTTQILTPPSDLNSTVSIAHIHAIGASDALHYLITTLELPTVLVARTSSHAKLNINWKGLLSSNHKDMAMSIKFGTPQDIFFSYGVAFTRLFDYNDYEDNSDIAYLHGHNMTVYNLNEFVWENMTEESDPGGNMVLIKATRTAENLWMYNGSLTFKFNAYDHDGRQPDLPHLQFNENITQFSLNLDHLWANFTKSRFAIEMVVIAHDMEEIKIDTTKSIDDEYSPGVFQIYNLLTKPSDVQTGFLQWKPVCYMDPSRSRRDATGMKHYDLTDLNKNNTARINETIFYGYYGDFLMTITTTSMNYSFGLTKDGGYDKTQYITWSASIGYGTPPEDAISTTVIIVISVGLGIPVLIIIGGGLLVCVKKRRAKVAKPLQDANEYKPIVNSE